MQVWFHRPFISHAKKGNFLPFQGEREVSIFCIAYKFLNSKTLHSKFNFWHDFWCKLFNKTTKLSLSFATRIPCNSVVILLSECWSHRTENYCALTVQILNKLAISAPLEVTRQGQD